MTGRKPRICLVTTGHPSTNPRLVKEADALVEAGYNVHVVACKFLAWADMADAQFNDREWNVTWVRFGGMARPLSRQIQRLRRAIASRVAPVVGYPASVSVRALHYVVPELTRHARSVEADLYIAHNLAALPAAYHAAQHHGAKLGFDAEDFHRGEFPDGDKSLLRQLTIRIEEAFIPRCDYVSAASDGIAEAYEQALSITRPTTVLNVFPLAERDVTLSDEERHEEKPDGIFSLYWFSQTIGPGRGLEDVVRALPRLQDDVYLSVRGQWASGYRHALTELASSLGVAERIRTLAPEPPQEMVVRAACHDIGLALEIGETENRRVCVTNKIFTYTLAGIPSVATDTPGQRGVASDLQQTVRLYRHGDIDAMVRQVECLRIGSPRASDQVIERFSWDHEKQIFLSLVQSITQA